MRRTLAVLNQKGGTGKTTTSVCLSSALAEMGHPCLVVDLDPQGNATRWLGTDPPERGLLHALMDGEGLDPLLVSTTSPGVDLLPSSGWLVSAERTLAAEAGAEQLLALALADLEGPWRFIFLDCPPSLGILSVGALTAADSALVPIEVGPMALEGVAALTATLRKVRERLNPRLRLGPIVPCRVDSRTRLSGEVVERLRARFGADVSTAMIRETVRLREAPSYRQAITQYAPESHGAQDYRELAAELIDAEEGRGASTGAA